MPGIDHAVELQDLRLEHPQLHAQRHDTRACNFWNPIVTSICHDREQFLNAPAADRRNDAELRKVGTDRIDDRSLLTDEEMASAMEHQATLLLGRLDLDEPHRCSGDGLADRLGIGCVVLLSLT